MEIKILGIGGFENTGLPFNSFLIDGHILCEAPPDILQSLHREKVRLEDIDTIVITHFHGDHCFGLPFALFNIFAWGIAGSQNKAECARKLRVIGPPGIKRISESLLALAISPDHPSIAWCSAEVDFIEIDDKSASPLHLPGGAWLKFARADHPVPTYSIIAGREGRNDILFIATSDTRWSPAISPLFAAKAKLILCDSNGRGFGGVHMSPDELEFNVLPLLAEGTTLIATHVSVVHAPGGPIRYARCGEIFMLKE